MKRLLRFSKYLLIVVLSLTLLIGISACVYMRLPKFGKAPFGERQARIEHSPNFKDGKFQNTVATRTLAEGHTMMGELYKEVFNKYPRRRPTAAIPAVKTDLLKIPPDSNLVVWFGHSSCFIQVSGKRILVDPVLSRNASPIPGTITPFRGTDIYTVADLPEIDYLLISHDHYDHLDYETVLALKDKTKHVICGLGVGADFAYWGYPAEKILEKDWHEKVAVDSGFAIYAEQARHKSGRAGFNQENTLWLSFVIKAPAATIFISGDTGYGPHFAGIGHTYGPIDLAILENGQYDSAWHNVHMLPVEVLKAAQDLHAERLLPEHSSKFTLARHAWDAPLVNITALNKKFSIPLVTPMIGEVVSLDNKNQVFKQWWVGIQ